MSSQQLQLPLASSSSSSSSSTVPSIFSHLSLPHGSNSVLFNCNGNRANAISLLSLNHVQRRPHNRRPIQLVRVGMEDAEARDGDGDGDGGNSAIATATAIEEDEVEPTPEDLEYIGQIKRVLELLRKNRDMLFGEVKLTIMIEDPREVERRRLLGIDDADAPTRDDLVAALEEVNEGKIPRNRIALRMLAEEMTGWPNLEAEAPKKKAKGRSLYAKATDTGVDPEVAAKRLNVDWDSAAEIEEAEVADDTEVPPAVGS